MLDSDQTHYQSAFAQFDSQLNELCDTDLGQKLHDPLIVQSSKIARRISTALNRLRDTVYDIRSEHGSKGPNRDWNPFIANPPPATPLLKRRISALESEIVRLKDTMEKRNMELEYASVRLDENREEMSNANKTIEKLGGQLASEYETNKRFDQAAEQYDLLSRLKDKEFNQKKSKNDSAGADKKFGSATVIEKAKCCFMPADSQKPSGPCDRCSRKGRRSTTTIDPRDPRTVKLSSNYVPPYVRRVWHPNMRKQRISTSTNRS